MEKKNGLTFGKREERREKSEKAITLIALIITIVILLILAGVTINLTLGDNGLFKTAEQAAKNYMESQDKELSYLEEYTNQINNIVNPLPFGTVIKRDGKINYIADGVGNMVPVPEGFTALTGTKTTGFVIKDTSLDSEGNPSATNGNEFVWVPVEGMGYTYNRYDFGKQNGSYSSYSETMSSDEQTSVATYCGYYIGRYEAGIVGYTAKSTTKDGTTTWTGYTGGSLVVQSGKEVWNYITRNMAVTEAGKLYNKANNNVTSKLCSSYAWDTALKFIETQNKTYTTNSVGGNYNTESGGTGEVQNTGYDTAHPCNIYDMGGNVWEWITESYSSSSYPFTVRGGFYSGSATAYPASYRVGGSETDAGNHIGFRVALFM